jgi:hypothetical protein
MRATTIRSLTSVAASERSQTLEIDAVHERVRVSVHELPLRFGSAAEDQGDAERQVFDPDPGSRVVPPHPATPQVTAGPHTLQILTTEHWSLLAARSLVYTEAMSRTSIFVAALSGAVVALALVA